MFSHRKPFQGVAKDLPEKSDEKSLHQKIRQRGVALSLVLIFLLAIGLYALDGYLHAPPPTSDKHQASAKPPWYEVFPFHALADACMVASIIGFIFEWSIRRQIKRELELHIGELFAKHTQFLANETQRTMGECLASERQNLLESLLLENGYFSKVVKPERLDEFMLLAIKAKYPDAHLPSDLFFQTLKRVLEFKNARYDFQKMYTLSNIKSNDIAKSAKYFHETIDISYRVKLTQSRFLFSCVTTQKDYLDRILDPDNAYTLFFQFTPEFPTLSSEVFLLKSFQINEKDVQILAQTNSQNEICYAIDAKATEQFLGTEVTIKYRFETVVQKRGHIIIFNLTQPTKGVNVIVDFARATDISFMNVFQFFFASSLPQVEAMEKNAQASKVSVSVREWVFPHGGAAFSWVLKQEMTTKFESQLNRLAVNG